MIGFHGKKPEQVLDLAKGQGNKHDVIPYQRGTEGFLVRERSARRMFPWCLPNSDPSLSPMY